VQKAGLSKEGFIATDVVPAVIVDIARLTVYGMGFLGQHLGHSMELAAPAVATSCAFAGAFFGKRVLGQVTYRDVQVTVAIAMLLIGFSLVAGLV
jgi:hypothetical protein